MSRKPGYKKGSKRSSPEAPRTTSEQSPKTTTADVAQHLDVLTEAVKSEDDGTFKVTVSTEIVRKARNGRGQYVALPLRQAGVTAEAYRPAVSEAAPPVAKRAAAEKPTERPVHGVNAVPTTASSQPSEDKTAGKRKTVGQTASAMPDIAQPQQSANETEHAKRQSNQQGTDAKLKDSVVEKPANEGEDSDGWTKVKYRRGY